MFKRIKLFQKRKVRNGHVECEKCGISKEEFIKQEKENLKQMKLEGRGIFIDFETFGLKKCSKCGRIICSNCTLKATDKIEEECPFCKERYGWGLLV